MFFDALSRESEQVINYELPPIHWSPSSVCNQGVIPAASLFCHIVLRGTNPITIAEREDNPQFLQGAGQASSILRINY